VYFKQFSVASFAEWAVKLPGCTLGMEACSSAHHWARFLGEHGHTAKLIAAEFVATSARARQPRAIAMMPRRSSPLCGNRAPFDCVLHARTACRLRDPAHGWLLN
jgi:transposase